MAGRRASVTSAEGGGFHAGSGKKIPGKEVDAKTLGFLYSGHLDKRNPITGSYKQRFVVLTRDAIHWFKRSDHSALFGDERGQIVLINIRSTRILNEDSTVCELVAATGKKTYFRSQTPQQIEEWVSAIRSAIRNATGGPSKQPLARRSSVTAGFTGIVFGEHEEDVDAAENSTPEVTISLVSFLSSAKSQQQVEIVLARTPEFGRLVALPTVKPGDQVIISTSNGGSVTLSYEVMLRYSEDDVDFEQTIQNVPLASSLKLSLTREIKLTANPAQDYAEEARKDGRALGRLDRVLQVVIVLTSERNSAISLILSVMVVMAGMGSLRFIGVDTSMLFVMAALLSIYNLQQVLSRIQADEKVGGSGAKALSLQLIIGSHSFTSPDAPVNEVEDEIPIAFINGCDQDLKEARRRWDITRHWREAEGVNNILNEPQPYYFLIKQMYPHFCCGWGKDGTSVIYNERVTEFEKDQLAARGVGAEELFRHWLFCSEYQWQVICKDHSETAKGITIQDVKGISMGFVTGDNMAFVKKTIATAGDHYPERSAAILVVNAPWIFSAIWKMISPLVAEATRKKVKILSAKDTLEGMKEFIDEENIPEWYGGKADYGGRDSVRFNHPMQLEMDRYVHKLNEGLDAAAGGDIASTADRGLNAVDRESPAPRLSVDRAPASGSSGSGSRGNRGMTHSTSTDELWPNLSKKVEPSSTPLPHHRRTQLVITPEMEAGGAEGVGSASSATTSEGRDWSVSSNTTRASSVAPLGGHLLSSPYAPSPKGTPRTSRSQR